MVGLFAINNWLLRQPIDVTYSLANLVCFIIYCEQFMFPAYIRVAKELCVTLDTKRKAPNEIRSL